MDAIFGNGFEKSMQAFIDACVAKNGYLDDDETYVCDEFEKKSMCQECKGYSYVPTPTGSRYCKTCMKRLFLAEANDWHQGWADWGITFSKIEAFPKFQPNEVYSACKPFLDDIKANGTPRALMLLGGNGRGKTVCPLAIIRELAEEAITGYAVFFPDMIAAMKKGIDGNAYLDKTYQRIKESRFVFIDELGKENSGGNAAHPELALRSIIDLCYRQKFLIISSNKSKNTLYYGDKEKKIPAYLEHGLFSRLQPALEGHQDRYVQKIVEVPYSTNGVIQDYR